MTFYQALLQSNQYYPFIERVQNELAAPTPLSTDTKIFILPAMLYKEHPEMGGDGELATRIANACGVGAATIHTRSLGGVTESLAQIEEAVLNEPREKVLFLTISRGGPQLRYLLQHSKNTKVLKKIIGWINLCGSSNGSKLVDEMISTKISRLKTKALSRAFGMRYSDFCEMASNHEIFESTQPYPEHIRIINVIGVPLKCHIQRNLIKRFSRIEKYGPNDGIVVLRDSLVLPGEIYPQWGADHFFRSSELSPLLYKLFRILI